MKLKLLFFLVGLLLTEMNRAQTITDVVEFIITDARTNEVDITEWTLTNREKIVFYRTEENSVVIMMSNYISNAELQSWGKIFDVGKEFFKDTADRYATDVFTFSWSCQNSYDFIKGLWGLLCQLK